MHHTTGFTDSSIIFIRPPHILQYSKPVKAHDSGGSNADDIDIDITAPGPTASNSIPGNSNGGMSLRMRGPVLLRCGLYPSTILRSLLSVWPRFCR